MIVNLKNNWKVDMKDDKGLRYLGNDGEVIVLDSTNEIILNIEVNENGNVKLRHIGYNIDFEIGEKIVYISINNNEPETTEFSTSILFDDGSLDGMTNREKVQAFVNESENPICDDCLSKVLSIEPINQVNKTCNDLKDEGEIIRDKGTCIFCEKTKLLNKRVE